MFSSELCEDSRRGICGNVLTSQRLSASGPQGLTGSTDCLASRPAHVKATLRLSPKLVSSIGEASEAVHMLPQGRSVSELRTAESLYPLAKPPRLRRSADAAALVWLQGLSSSKSCLARRPARVRALLSREQVAIGEASAAICADEAAPDWTAGPVRLEYELRSE